jgi:hypothetical protein
MNCPHCQSPDLVFDLARDERIFLSFWVCPGCGRHGIARMFDRAPAATPADVAATGHRQGAALRSARGSRSAPGIRAPLHARAQRLTHARRHRLG